MLDFVHPAVGGRRTLGAARQTGTDECSWGKRGPLGTLLRHGTITVDIILRRSNGSLGPREDTEAPPTGVWVCGGPDEETNAKRPLPFQKSEGPGLQGSRGLRSPWPWIATKPDDKNKT